ncbi:MAG: hypothetical protein ABW168_18905 [Sedimenticola sp.]
MAMAKYKISDEDRYAANRWLEKKVAKYGWISKDFKTEDKAKQVLSSHSVYNSAEQLNAWCETYLDSAQWRQLKNAVRAARKRNSDAFTERKKSIDLTHAAWFRLSVIAKCDGVTLSEVIVKHLDKEFESALKEVEF